MKIDFNKIGSGKTFEWTKEYLLKYLSTCKTAAAIDPKIIAALRSVDRADFIPSSFKEKAYQDIEIPLGYGETATRPSVIAQMLQLLEPKVGGRYLDIGTGSGYFAVLLGFIASDSGKVFSIERIQWIWEKARESASKYKEIKNIHFLYRDGLLGLAEYGPFDGIHIAFALDLIPDEVKKQLAIGGKLVCPSKNYDVRVLERLSEDDYVEEIISGFVFAEGKEGVG